MRKYPYISPITEEVLTLSGRVMQLADGSDGLLHGAPARRINTLGSVGTIRSIGSLK